MNRRIIAVALTLVGTSPALLAQEAPQPNPAPEAAPVSSESETAVAGVTGGSSKETLSVDFPNAEIRTILRNIADLFELNLVIPEGLQGRASLKLRDVTWKQIFDVLLTPVGYTYVTDGNIIKVVSIESLNVEPAETRIFLLNYARAGDIAPTVTSMVEAAKGGKVQVDVRSNALVVTERPKRLEKVDEIIKRLDKATAQVMIEAKFVEVVDTNVKDLGVDWVSLSGYGVGLQPTDLLIKGGANAGRNIDGEMIDGTPDVSNASHVYGAVLSSQQFAWVLSALQTNSKSKVISNPTVVTINNQEALISVGRQYPIPSYTYNQERGTYEISGFEYRDIGIILRVTPQVNNAGLINLKVDPEVSNFNPDENVEFGGASGATIPVIRIKRTVTQVAIKDGYTMGLGGLISTAEGEGESKVPVLGDIPGLGRLFRSNSKSSEKANLIVFITAKTLSPEGSTYKDIFAGKWLTETGVTDEDAPVSK
jgi:type IV pilus assembly protein PilQ